MPQGQPSSAADQSAFLQLVEGKERRAQPWHQHWGAQGLYGSQNSKTGTLGEALLSQSHQVIWPVNQNISSCLGIYI
jgi:hypothetical protein